MASPVDPTQRFERSLLRRGVGALQADRDCCADCGRTPLTGERVHLYERIARGPGPARARGGMVCELCRAKRPEAPVASALVRPCEHGRSVRVRDEPPELARPLRRAAPLASA